MNADSLRRELMATDDEIKAPPILVPLDGSAQSEAALSHAALLARRLDAPLALIMIPLLYHSETLHLC